MVPRLTVAIVICNPMATNPQYTAAKHALVGLARACGIDSTFVQENISQLYMPYICANKPLSTTYSGRVSTRAHYADEYGLEGGRCLFRQ